MSKSKAKARGPQRHVPMRTCVACQRTRAKRELVRVVHTPSGTVEVDPGGKKAGRGAYLCPTKECWETGLKKRVLQRALRTEISEADLGMLADYAAALPREEEDAGAP